MTLPGGAKPDRGSQVVARSGAPAPVLQGQNTLVVDEISLQSAAVGKQELLTLEDPKNPSGSENSLDLDSEQLRRGFDAQTIVVGSGGLEKCKYNPPLVAQRIGPAVLITEASCRSFTCPIHGPQVAERHRLRIILGAQEVAAQGRAMWFATITCRGKDLSLADAEAEYGRWTKRLLDALRGRAKRRGDRLTYVATTERQARGHPHGHLIMAGFEPVGEVCLIRNCHGGSEPFHVPGRYDGQCGYNQDFVELNVKAGLGPMARIAPVESIEAVAVYCAKYLTKPDVLANDWPPKWRRIRYSQDWPEVTTGFDDQWSVITPDDWGKVADVPFIIAPDPEIRGLVAYHVRSADGTPAPVFDRWNLERMGAYPRVKDSSLAESLFGTSVAEKVAQEDP